jgi:hypothetical protein
MVHMLISLSLHSNASTLYNIIPVVKGKAGPVIN